MSHATQRLRHDDGTLCKSRSKQGSRNDLPELKAFVCDYSAQDGRLYGVMSRVSAMTCIGILFILQILLIELD
jgi:hypothetical protein